MTTPAARLAVQRGREQRAYQYAQERRVPERARPAMTPAQPAQPAQPQRAPKQQANVGTLLSEGGASYGLKKAANARRARIPTGNRQYQGVILAEFLVAVLIVALAPLARGKAATDKTTGPSPYGVDDVKQLVGIGAVYFILALLSSGKHGRFAAWFGGLILVAIGLSETTSGGLPAIFGIFSPAATSAGDSGTLAPVPLGFLPENGPLPTPGGAPTFGESVTSGGAVSSVAFTQPGVVVSDQGNVQVNP